MGLSSGDGFFQEKDETQVPLRDEIGGSGGDVNGMEPNSVFKPIGHPLEPPPDEDRPIKCPMPPNSSILDNGGMRKERFTESLRKRGEISSVVNDDGMVVVATEPPAQAVRKRHHTLTREDTTTPLFRRPSPPLPPTQSTTIFQVLQECDESES